MKSKMEWELIRRLCGSGLWVDSLGASVYKGQVEEEEHTWNKIRIPHSDLQTPTRACISLHLNQCAF